MNRHIFVSLIFLKSLFIVCFWCFYSNTYVCPRKHRPATLLATFLANRLTGLKPAPNSLEFPTASFSAAVTVVYSFSFYFTNFWRNDTVRNITGKFIGFLRVLTLLICGVSRRSSRWRDAPSPALLTDKSTKSQRNRSCFR